MCKAITIVAALISPVALGQTFVGPIHYVSSADSPFDTSHPSFVLENFEDDLFNIPGVTANLNNDAVIGPGGLTDSVDADDGVINGNGTNGHSFFNGSGATGVTFTFNPRVLGGLPTHAGVVWTDGGGTTLFEAFGAGDVSLGTIGPVSIATGGFTGQTDEDHFFGVIHGAGIAKIKISNTAGGIEVDHFQFSFAPSECVGQADVNGDGFVNGADLGLLLAAWETAACDADLNGDGTTDGADLGLLLAEWTG